MEKERNGVAPSFWGRLLSAVALIFCVPVGLYFASIAMEFVGIILGVAGYGLGARRLGGLTIVLCAVAMLLGYLINQEVGR